MFIEAQTLQDEFDKMTIEVNAKRAEMRKLDELYTKKRNELDTAKHLCYEKYTRETADFNRSYHDTQIYDVRVKYADCLNHLNDYLEDLKEIYMICFNGEKLNEPAAQINGKIFKVISKHKLLAYFTHPGKINI